MKNQKGISLTTVILIIAIFIVSLILLFVVKNNHVTNTESSSTTSSSINETYGLGDTIKFDGLELSFDSTYSFVTLNNEQSDYNEKSVIKLGVNVKNISSETNRLNTFYYDLSGSKGTKLDNVTKHFDDNIDYAGDLKPGASYKSYFYILYDGNGNYSIDFDNFSEKTSVEFEIIK